MKLYKITNKDGISILLFNVGNLYWIRKKGNLYQGKIYDSHKILTQCVIDSL